MEVVAVTLNLTMAAIGTIKMIVPHRPRIKVFTWATAESPWLLDEAEVKWLGVNDAAHSVYNHCPTGTNIYKDNVLGVFFKLHYKFEMSDNLGVGRNRALNSAHLNYREESART